MILHPSQFDFGRPFDYIADLYEATLNSGSTGGSIAPDADGRGIKLQPNNPVTVTSAVVQRKYLVTPAAGKRILMASRVFLSNATDVLFWYGFWSPDSNPFSGEPDEAAVIKKAASGLSMVGRTISDTSAGETSLGFSFENETFIDICVMLHGTDAVEFLVARNDETANGTWASVVRTSNISNEAMRPSFAVQITTTGHYAVIRSLYVHEEEL